MGHRDDYVNREVIREAQRERERDRAQEYREYVNQAPLMQRDTEDTNTAQRRHRTQPQGDFGNG